jgi:hypothetical protein
MMRRLFLIFFNTVFLRVFLLAVLFLASPSLYAEDVPKFVSLQASIFDQNGEPLDGVVTRVDVALYSGDTLIDDWSEKHVNVDFLQGVGVLELGSINPLTSSVFDVSTPNFRIKIDGVDVDPIYLNSVVYSLKSSSTDHIAWADIEGIPAFADNGPPIEITFTDTVHFTEVDNGASGTAITIDWRDGNKQKVILTDDTTFTFTNPVDAASLMLVIYQDGIGGHSVTWGGSSIHWPSGRAPSLTTDTNAIDVVTFYYDETNYLGMGALDFRAAE